ncbi:MAG: UpxY family transcription antiterminator [Acidobacteriia bacterium]|nr:UpxY family transcription antiterminator [Terriglobia bacterium]
MQPAGIRELGEFGGRNSEHSLIDWQQPNWYVLFVRSNQEKKVAQGLHDRGIEHFLPCYSSLRQWKDRRVKLETPLFRGYLFVRLPLLERMRVLTVPYAVSLIGRKEAPAVISPEEIDWIRKSTSDGKVEPHEYLKAGQQVMITAGVLAGMKGILLRRHNQTRVVVLLDSIWRAFAVEVDADCVELVKESRPLCDFPYKTNVA